VDIQPQAVDICKLRLWLSLMVDYELSADPDNCEATSFRKALKEIEPLPNLDFKIRRANSLVDYIHGEPVELKQLSSETGAALALSNLSAAKREFFNARTAAAKRKLRLAIYQNITELAKIELTRARMDAAGLGIALTDRDGERVTEIDNGLKEIAFIAAQLRDARKMRAQAQEDALERIRAQFDDSDKPTFVWQFDFAEVFHREDTAHGESLLPVEKTGPNTATSLRNGFDLVIGNPPYIRIQTLTKSNPKLAAYYKQRYKAAAKGNYDLYVCFVERGLELLHQNGQLAFIQPHKFFNAQYGEPLRDLLAKGKHLRHVVHFGDQQIFPGATNYVCLLFLAKAGANKCHFVRVGKLATWLSTFAGDEADIAANDIGAADWNFAVGKGASVFERLKQLPTRFGDIAARISQGIRTSANEVYVLDVKVEGSGHVEAYSEQLEAEFSLERKSVYRFLGGREIKPYRILPSGKVAIIPYRLSGGRMAIIPKQEYQERFPSTWSYLCKNRSYLEDRENGKMKGNNWYGFVYPKNLDIMVSPKLLVPDIADRASFALDEAGTFAFTSGYGITLKQERGLSLKYVLGLANSSVLDFYWRQISTPLRGGFFRNFTQFIEQLPIPESNAEQRALLESAVTSVVWLHACKSVRAGLRETTNVPLISAFMEQWVNALVYELFFPREIHDAGLQFFDLIQSLNLPPLESLAESARLQELQKIFTTTYASDHKLRQAMYRLGSLDLVRTIEGKT
jgi:hypothetical protein